MNSWRSRRLQYMLHAELLQKHLEKDKEFSAKETVLKLNELHLYKSGAFIYHQGTLTEPRISIPLGLVSVDKAGVCATGVPSSEIKALHDEMRAPATGRFSSTKDHESYPFSIQLEGVGAIYDMVRCAKRPDHPAVRAEMEQWMNASPMGRTALHKGWEVTAKSALKTAFSLLRAEEMRRFEGAKSYFRCKEEGLDPAADDQEVIVLSDTE
jgi:hypothetical protein